MLDFVPNHTGLGHPWVETHPDYYIHGGELDLLREPHNYTWVRRTGGDVLLAHGRDPYFPGWRDTLQLDYANPALQAAMSDELVSIAARCDGVRCDMAMLVLPDVFERTWGREAPPFWGHATARARESHPGFMFMAEVYWDLEWTMIQQGFDYAYDKRLYDRLRGGVARPVREHLWADLDYQRHLARFLENHDEPRAAATFPRGQHQAAAVVTFLTPGLRFLQAGQLEGRRVHVSPHLVRAPDEQVDDALAAFYARLLPVLRRPVVRDGTWRMLECASAWDGDGTSEGFIAWTWENGEGARLVVTVNYAGDRPLLRPTAVRRLRRSLDPLHGSAGRRGLRPGRRRPARPRPVPRRPGMAGPRVRGHRLRLTPVVFWASPERRPAAPGLRRPIGRIRGTLGTCLPDRPAAPPRASSAPGSR